MSRKTRHILWWVTLLLIAASATLVRIPGLTVDGFWFDELLTAEFIIGRDDVTRTLPYDTLITPMPDLIALDAAAPPWSVWTHLHATVHPPLYYVAVRLWAEVFGASDVSLRSFSLVCGVLSAVLLAVVVARHSDRVAGAMAGGLLALSAPQIYFSHEARHYALATLLLLCAAGCVDAPRLGKWRRPMLAGCLLLVPLTHYFAVGAAAAIGIWALVREDKRWRLLAWIGAAVLVFGAAWGPQFAQQLQDGFRTTSWMPTLSRGFPEFARHVGQLPLGLLVYERLLSNPVLALSWLLWLIPLGLAIYHRDGRALLWLLWFPLALLPAVLIEVFTRQTTLFYPRYTMFAAPGFCAVVALGLWALRNERLRWTRYAVPAAALLMTAIELTRPYNQHWPDHKPFATLLAERYEPGDGFIIVRSPSYERNTHALYRAVSHYVLDDSASALWIMDQQPARMSNQRVWLIAGPDATTPAPPGYVKRYQEGFPPTASLSLLERVTPEPLPE